MKDLRSSAITTAALVAVFARIVPMATSLGSEVSAEIASHETDAVARSNVKPYFTPPFMLASAQVAQPRDNDYPTADRVDYVIGCMAANGNTRDAMLKCSCAIDTIAGLMPYSDYERAETALSLQLGGGVGGRVGLFRDPPQIKAVIEELRRAQAEANLQCR
jgi:hypothetical protein